MSSVKVRGLNHLTLAVTDLERSIGFYRDLLGCELRARWGLGAYLEAGSLWLCLSVDDAANGAIRADYTHYAFDVAPDSFNDLAELLSRHAVIWKENVSEGSSLYFLDPDGHRLEIHQGSLESRLAHYDAEAASEVIRS